MVGTRRFAGQFKAQQGYQWRTGIGQIVDRIGGDRNAVKQQSHGYFVNEQQQIWPNPHDAGQFSVVLANPGIAGIFIIFNQFFY